MSVKIGMDKYKDKNKDNEILLINIGVLNLSKRGEADG